MSSPPPSIDVLHVDDDPQVSELAAIFLERETDAIAVQTVTTPTDALERLATGDIDCIVSDYDMPGMNGIEFLQTVRDDYPDLPFILYTGKGSEEVASDAISAGVTEYLQKEAGTGQYTVLANRITNAVEQYRSAHALEASRNRLALFFEQSPLGVIEWTESFEVARINAAAEAILGYTEAELRGASWEMLVPPTEQSAVDAIVEQLLVGDGGFHSINENVRKDGSRIICEWHNRVVTDEAGDVVAIFSQFQDITERRRQRQELERHRAVVEAANSTIITVDESGVVQSVNPAVEAAFGYSPADLVGESVTTLMSDAVAKQHTAAFERYLETGEQTLDWDYVELVGQHRDESAVPLAVTFGEVHHGDERLFVGILRDISDRKARQAELREKERRYQAVFNDPNILVGLLDPDGTVVAVNDTAGSYIDTPAADLTGELFWDAPWFAHSKALQSDIKSWVTRAAAGEYVEFEADHVTAEGDLFTVEGVFRPVTDEEGDVVSLLVSSHDITEQTEHKQELEWTNAVLSTLLTTLPIGVLAESDDREVLAMNPRLTDLFNLETAPQESVGADCEQLAESLSAQFSEPSQFISRIEEIASTGRSVHGETVDLADGRTFVRSHEPIELPDGEGHLWTYRDVTAQRAYEDRLAALNETAQDLLTAPSRERVVQIGVHAARDVLGLDANAIHLLDADRTGLVPVASTNLVADIIGELPTFTPGDSIAWRVFDEGEALAVDDTHEHPDIYNPESPIRSELYFPLGDYGILIAGSQTPGTFGQKDLVLGQILAGNIVSALDQVDEMHQRRARERELAAQNDRLEEFASIVSHDLRNPLNVAEGRVALAQETRDWDQLTAVQQAFDRMNALIDDLLALARTGALVSDTEPVELASVVERCWANVPSAGATLQVSSKQVVHADRSRLQQLLENLLRNAVDHGGSSVTVHVGDLPTGFFVEDDGSGIPSDIRDTAFRAGWSTRDDGTGFGLSIVQQIVTAHGWAITVRNGSRGGARFEITGVEVEAS